MAGGGNGFWHFIVLYTARTLSDSGDNLGELLVSEPTLAELVGVKAKPCTDEEAEEVVETNGQVSSDMDYLIEYSHAQADHNEFAHGPAFHNEFSPGQTDHGDFAHGQANHDEFAHGLADHDDVSLG